MKLTNWTVIFLILITSFQLYGQDTVSVFFEFGDFKILDNQLDKLNNISTKYDLSDLKSVSFIGMADSTGEFDANVKLSEKRAKNVARYCERMFPKNTSINITALGERTNHSRDKNRRVDIVFYFKSNLIDENKEIEVIETKNVCYNIDYKLLHRSHIRTVTKRKKDLTIIETTLPDLKKKNEHYYGSSTKNGGFISKKVKWRSKRTGKLWWSETRFIATIPKKDFDTYKIFKIGKIPCDTCNEDFQKNKEISKEDTCLQVDRFLMENIQFKTILFNDRWVRIRVPREYVNIKDKYFIACNTETEIVWKTKNRRRKRNYYFTRLPKHFNVIANITRIMDCCKYNSEPSECNKPKISCQSFGSSDKSFILNAEIGNHYQQSTISPYAAIGISKEGDFTRFSFLTGTDNDLSLYSSLRFQYYFSSFLFSSLNPFSTWHNPTKLNIINRYGRLYLGTELKTRINKTQEEHLEQNLHIGLAFVNTNEDAFVPRIFIQYGFGFEYLASNSKGKYSILQIGLNMNIARLIVK